ncbi:deoxyhypusine synthase family protein [Xenorhabdus stockiae]|uniref:deoxyhypusine synthase family protein n=1 Tax=Xenorhabdus stockiae TaxID=351614 RepID=UPI004064AF16
MNEMPVFDFICNDYHHFNAGALKRALFDYHQHISAGGKMFWSLAGALSTARIGIVLAPAIRAGLIHGLSVTGANLEESLLHMLYGDSYQYDWNYRYLSLQDDAAYLKKDFSRVTDTLVPAQAFDKLGALLKESWLNAQQQGERHFWHEYFYELALQMAQKPNYATRAKECWLLAAAQQQLPILVGGHADSSLGNFFTSECYLKKLTPGIIKSDIEYMMEFYDTYQHQLAVGSGCGYMQIGGGIAGDFAMCVVPALRHDLNLPVPHWAYYCQVSDCTTSFGSYSGAGANEKITWDKTNADTPAHLIESDASLVVPLLLEALLEAKQNPHAAEQRIAQFI